MIKMTQLLLAAAVALVLSDAGLAQDTLPRPTGAASAYLTALFNDVATQDTLPDPLPPAPDAGVGGGVLQALPKPRDLPASLFAPSPPPSTGFLRTDTPYFIRDPLLDPAQVPAPGWFAGAELQVVKPHLMPGLMNTVQNRAQKANTTSTTVALPSASLDWTVSPRVFVGYRLPSGFGEFMVAYRHLGTQGSGFLSGANGPAGLNSRFAFDIVDFDYNTRELSLGPQWDMKWSFGLRFLSLFFDSQANQTLDQTTVGSGPFLAARDSNNLFGFGPHTALELGRRLGDSGFSLYAWTDVAGTYDYTQQGFSTQSKTLGPNGRPLAGATSAFGHQAAPMINGRLGLTWQPAPSSGTRVFLGYQYEVFWDLDRVNNISSTPFLVPSLGQFWDQGIVMQATFRY